MKQNKTLWVLFVLYAVISMACSLPGGLSHAAQVPTALPSPSITPVPVPTPTGTRAVQVCTVTATHLNMRETPGMNAAVITVLNSGEVVTLDPTEAAQASWVFVTARGLDGWINQNFCK